MTTDDTTRDAPGQPLPPPTAPDPRPLTRSAHYRVLTGVCGGLGSYTGVDPVVYRVLAVVLTLFGGAGLLAYVAAWLLLPDERTGRAIIDLPALRHGHVLAPVAVIVGAAAVLGLLLDGLTPVRGHWRFADVAALAIIALVAYAVAKDRRATGAAAVSPAGAHAPEPPGPGSASPWPPGYPPSGLAQPVPPQYATAAAAQAGSATTGYPTPASGGVAAGPAATEATPAPPTPPARRGPSTTGAAWSLLAVAAGLVVLLTGAGRMSATVALATLLGVVAVTLVVTAFVRRPGGFLALGIVLALVLGVVAPVEHVTGRFADLPGGGTVRYQPLSAAAVQPRYALGGGDLTLDLAGVPAAAPVTTSVRLGVGQLSVLLPADANVAVTASAGLGQVTVLGRPASGVRAEQVMTDLVGTAGRAGPGGSPTVWTLTLSVGVGEVVVDREP